MLVTAGPDDLGAEMKTERKEREKSFQQTVVDTTEAKPRVSFILFNFSPL